MNSTLKRKKSIDSHAASISAWCAVFDWPIIVAALSVSRHGPESSSAARKTTAARSSHDQRDQSSHAFAAASIACSTCSGPPWWTSASTCSLSCGITTCLRSPVVTSLPPMTSGISMRSLRIWSSRRFRRSRSGLAGVYSWIGSLCGCGGRKIAWLLMRRTLRPTASGPEQIGRRHDDPDHEAEHRGVDLRACERPAGRTFAHPDPEHCDSAREARAAEPAVDLARAHGGERRSDDHDGCTRCGGRGELRLAQQQRRGLERDRGRAPHRDDSCEEPVRVVAHQLGAEAREEPHERERGAGEQRRLGVLVIVAERERRNGKADVGISERRDPYPGHAATLQHRRMRPTLLQYDAPGFGLGEGWLDGDTMIHSELPRPRRGRPSHVRVSDTRLAVVRRLERFFAGEEEDFADVRLSLPDGFLGACAEALRAVPRGEVVTY